MAGLKHELDQWNEGVIAFDQGLYEDALDLFEPIADSAKIHFNIGVVLTTLGDFEGASAAYEEATNLDQYLAIGYFQNGVANVALENYSKALKCFHDAYLYLRGNMVIDYTQLGLDFKLYSCQVLLNRALCYIELGEMDLGMTDLWRATREKQTKAHDILDQALRDKGQDCTVFTVPQGVLYRPAESKVKNSKKKDYLGNSKVIAAVDATDQFAGFQGKSAWQVQMSGPTNVAVVEEPRPSTPPLGLQRRATERVPGVGRSRRGTDPERPRMLEHAASFNAGPGPSGLGLAGSDLNRPSLLSRRNTESQKPQPLNLDGNSNIKGARAIGAPSAAPLNIGQRQGPGQQQSTRGWFQDEIDDIDQHVQALHMDSDRMTNGGVPPVPTMSSAYANSSALPTRSNSSANVRPGMARQYSNANSTSPPMGAYGGGNGSANGSTYSTSPPTNRGPGTAPVLAELRRAGSGGRGLRREDSLRSAISNGGQSSVPTNASPLSYSPSVMGGANGARPEEGSYLDEPVYAGLRDKLRVKCHYIDTRAVLVRVDTPLQELIQRVHEKFQTKRPLKLKYKDEDHHMLSMIDDEDWLMAQQVHMETMGSLDRMELWCFDEDD
ncbi:hypothetical protein EMPS_06127 [Entomortierella parvispora]|uniref:PB1 domain-containing protein n=1 Tax=Entomortierella parvispora TaxID=205924 RepID=A0A9P3HBP3_9FUNG|nr:hypothetical protein EMPS_06127 [Entomortierella parvispora]